MNKPNGFDETQGFSSFEQLEEGGHVLKILNVEERKSQAGNDMIVVSFDTDKVDKQPGYFKQRYDGDTRSDKKWPAGGRTYQVCTGSNGNCSKGFKTFIECVEASNNGFKVQWGSEKVKINKNGKIIEKTVFEKCFEDKLIGGNFGKEEYLNSYGESKFTVKLSGFRTVQDVKNGKVQAPKPKMLENTGNSYGNNNNYNGGYDDITPVDDGDMPF